MELVPIGDRHAQHFGDDRGGNRQRELPDQIDRIALARRLQQLVRQRFDARPQLFHQIRRERLLHQPPQPSVIGRIGMQHVPCERQYHFRQPWRFDLRIGFEKRAKFFREPLVFQHHRHVVVARHNPRRLLIGQQRAINRRLAPQPRIKLIGLRFELAAGDIHRRRV